MYSTFVSPGPNRGISHVHNPDTKIIEEEKQLPCHFFHIRHTFPSSSHLPSLLDLSRSFSGASEHNLVSQIPRHAFHAVSSRSFSHNPHYMELSKLICVVSMSYKRSFFNMTYASNGLTVRVVAPGMKPHVHDRAGAFG